MAWTYGLVSSPSAHLEDLGRSCSVSMNAVWMFAPDGADSAYVEGPSGTVPVGGPLVRYTSSEYDAAPMLSQECLSAFNSAGARYKAVVAAEDGMADVWLLFKSGDAAEIASFSGDDAAPDVMVVTRSHAAGPMACSVYTPMYSVSERDLAIGRLHGFRRTLSAGSFSIVSDSVSSARPSTVRRESEDPSDQPATDHLVSLGSLQSGTLGASANGGSSSRGGYLVRLGPDGKIDHSMLPRGFDDDTFTVGGVTVGLVEMEVDGYVVRVLADLSTAP